MNAVSPAAVLGVSRIENDPAISSALVDVLCRAFDRDPHINWLIRQDTGRAEAMAALFQLLLTEMGGELHATADRQSAALWYPPGNSPNLGAQTRFFLRFLAIAGPLRALKRGVDLKRMDRQHPQQPHFHLQLLGVAPEYQGSGHGRALLEHLQALAQASGSPIYLETSSPQNVAFYARHGFATTAECTLSDHLRLWSLAWQCSGINPLEHP